MLTQPRNGDHLHGKCGRTQNSLAEPGRLTPGNPLPGAQALPGIGDGVLGPQPLRSSVEQVHAPGVGVAAVLCGEKITVGRRRIDAGQHGCCALKELVVQAHAYAR